MLLFVTRRRFLLSPSAPLMVPRHGRSSIDPPPVPDKAANRGRSGLVPTGLGHRLGVGIAGSLVAVADPVRRAGPVWPAKRRIGV